MKQVVIFSRTSTTQQDVEQQTKVLIDEAKRIGYAPEQQIIIEYQESGIKLDANTRIGIKKLKDTIASNSNIDCVICWELTRIARRADVIYNIRDFLLEHKICWIVLKPSYMELIDRSGMLTPTMSLMLGIFTSFAESEMMIKKERFIRAKEELRRNGKKFGGATTFGYIKNSEKYCIPHPVHSKIIVEAFDYYVRNEDASLYETYKHISSMWPDIFPMVEYTKAQHKIRHLFDNSVYATGNWCYPPLVSEETMQRVKDKMSKAVCKPRYNSRLQFLGRGKVRCGHCGNIMTGCGGNVNAYVCSTDKLHSLQINYKAMDWLIWEEVRVAANIAASMDNYNKVVEMNKAIQEKENLLAQYNAYEEEISSKIEKLLSIYLDEKIPVDIYNKKYSELEGELANNKTASEKIAVQINELKQSLQATQEMTNIKYVNYDNIDNFETKLEMVRKYIKDITLTRKDDGFLYIQFRWIINLIIPKCTYKYISKGGRYKFYRINEDGTEDLL